MLQFNVTENKHPTSIDQPVPPEKILTRLLIHRLTFSTSMQVAKWLQCCMVHKKRLSQYKRH